MSEKMRRKDYKFAPEDTGDKGQFTGFLSVFGNVDSYGDVVKRGAFAKTIAEDRVVPVLWQHDSDEPIGKFTSLTETAKGLKVAGELLINDDPVAARAFAHLKAGTISGLSIGYRMTKFAVNKNGGFDIEEVDLWEGSIVTFPANEAAYVDTVKAVDRIKTIREFEDFLRDAGGFSHSAAKAIASCGFKGHSEPRDEDGGELAEILRRNISAMKG